MRMCPTEQLYTDLSLPMKIPSYTEENYYANWGDILTTLTMPNTGVTDDMGDDSVECADWIVLDVVMRCLTGPSTRLVP